MLQALHCLLHFIQIILELTQLNLLLKSCLFHFLVDLSFLYIQIGYSSPMIFTLFRSFSFSVFKLMNRFYKASISSNSLFSPFLSLTTCSKNSLNFLCLSNSSFFSVSFFFLAYSFFSNSLINICFCSISDRSTSNLFSSTFLLFAFCVITLI